MRWPETIVAVLLAGAVTLGEIFACKVATAPSTPDQLREVTVHVLAFQGEESDGSGSGVLFKGSDGRNYVFTAGHCVPDECDQRMVIEIHALDAMAPLEQLDAEIVWVDRQRDFAVLKLAEGPFSSYAVMSPQGSATLGQRVQHIGFFGGHQMPHAYSSGKVFFLGSRSCNWIAGTADAADFLAMPGCSGGGVFDSKGQLVGIVIGVTPYGLSFYVPVHDIDESLAEARLGVTF